MIDLEELAQRTARTFACPPLSLAGRAAGPMPDWQDLSAVVSALQGWLDSPVIGVSGSQGSGKSTLANILVDCLGQLGISAAAVSIDDFYLTRSERRALAAQIHPLLSTRGVPGTHDWAWLGEVLQAAAAGVRQLRVPRFDKGRDDRRGVEQLRADVLVMEGWCLGVTHQPAALLADPVNLLEAEEDADGTWRRWVNEQIRQYYQPLWSKIGVWVHLQAPNFAVVRDWRAQQEAGLPAAQRMSMAELDRFIAHYERLTRWQLQSRRPGPGFAALLDQQRNVTRVTVGAGAQL